MDQNPVIFAYSRNDWVVGGKMGQWSSHILTATGKEKEQTALFVL